MLLITYNIRAALFCIVSKILASLETDEVIMDIVRIANAKPICSVSNGDKVVIELDGKSNRLIHIPMRSHMMHEMPLITNNLL